MRNEDEQIEGLLRGGVGDWADEQVSSPTEFEDLDFHDFFSVTPDQVAQHVLRVGFPIGVVWAPGQPMQEKDDRYVVEPSGAIWKVYYTQRGCEQDCVNFATREAAVFDVVMRVFESAWVMLGHRYWHAHHPELLCMPAFGVPWPRPKAPAGQGSLRM